MTGSPKLQKLRDKGIDTDLIKELEDMGPEASAMLHVMNNDPAGGFGRQRNDGSPAERIRFTLAAKKRDFASRKTRKENEDLKMQTEQEVAPTKPPVMPQYQLNKNSEQKIATLEANAQAEIKAYTEEYLKGVNDLQKPINGSSRSLQNQAAR